MAYLYTLRHNICALDYVQSTPDLYQISINPIFTLVNIFFGQDFSMRQISNKTTLVSSILDHIPVYPGLTLCVGEYD